MWQLRATEILPCVGFIPAEFGNRRKRQGSVWAIAGPFSALLCCSAALGPWEVVSGSSWLVGEPSALLVILSFNNYFSIYYCKLWVKVLVEILVGNCIGDFVKLETFWAPRF